MPLTPQQIPDYVVSTLNILNKGTAAQTQALSKYPLSEFFFSSGMAKVTTRGGDTWERRIRLRASTSTRFVQLFQTTPLARQSYMGKVQFSYTNIEDKSIVYDDREPIFNSGEEQIVDYINDTMYDAAVEGFWNTMENAIAGAPTDSADATSLLGLFYWASLVQTGQTDPIGGFNGQFSRYSGGTFTTGAVGNIDPTNALNERWRNWCATHDGTFGIVTRNTLRRAINDVKFQRLKGLKQDTGRSGKWSIFLPEVFGLAYEEEVNTAGTDDLKGDLARYNGELTFRGVPLKLTPAFNSLTFQPILGVYSKHVFGLTDPRLWYKFNKTTPPQEQHHTQAVALEGTCQLGCDNRREGLFVIHAGV